MHEFSVIIALCVMVVTYLPSTSFDGVDIADPVEVVTTAVLIYKTE